MAERDVVAGVAGVCFGPAPRRPLGEELVGVGTLLAGDAPGLDFVGKMPDVAFVIQREPFDGTVADP